MLYEKQTAEVVYGMRREMAIEKDIYRLGVVFSEVCPMIFVRHL